MHESLKDFIFATHVTEKPAALPSRADELQAWKVDLETDYSNDLDAMLEMCCRRLDKMCRNDEAVALPSDTKVTDLESYIKPLNEWALTLLTQLSACYAQRGQGKPTYELLKQIIPDADDDRPPESKQVLATPTDSDSYALDSAVAKRWLKTDDGTSWPTALTEQQFTAIQIAIMDCYKKRQYTICEQFASLAASFTPDKRKAIDSKAS